MAKVVNVMGTSASVLVKQLAAIADATVIDNGGADAISLSIPSGSSMGVITVYACPTSGGTYQIFVDPATGQDVTFTATAAREMLMPYACNGYAGYFKLICAGTANSVVATGKRASRL